MNIHHAPFRILSLDGGGIRGTFIASILATWEESTKLRVRDHFDLVAGTSTGGILAIGLGLGLTARQLLDFYIARGPVIFPGTGMGRRRLGRALRQLVQPKYSAEVLREELTSAFGQRRFGESTLRLLIPAYDTLRARLYLFKTRHHPRFDRDEDLSAVDVAMATAAAPTYFRAASVGGRHGQGYVDGGVWASSPALAAVVESLTFLGCQLSDLHVLSIGTTYAPESVRELAGGGMGAWATRIVQLLVNAQVEAAQAECGLLLGERHVRVDCLTKPGEYALDDSNEIQLLAALGRSKAVERAILEPVRERFLNGTTAAVFERDLWAEGRPEWA